MRCVVVVVVVVVAVVVIARAVRVCVTGLTGSSALGWDGTQVSTRLRNMVTAAYPEAVGRRRAEEVSALATAELLQLVPSAPSTDSHQALVQVCCCVPPQQRASFTNREKPKGEERLG